MIIQTDSNIPLDIEDIQLLSSTYKRYRRKLRLNLTIIILICLTISYISDDFSNISTAPAWDVCSAFLLHNSLLLIGGSAYLLLYYRKHLYPVRADLKNQTKDQIIFNPQPYHITGTPQFFMNTGISSLPYIEISFEAFRKMNGTEMLVFEMAPISKIHLGIKPLMDIMDTPHGAPGEI